MWEKKARTSGGPRAGQIEGVVRESLGVFSGLAVEPSKLGEPKWEAQEDLNRLARLDP